MLLRRWLQAPNWRRSSPANRWRQYWRVQATSLLKVLLLILSYRLTRGHIPSRLRYICQQRRWNQAQLYDVFQLMSVFEDMFRRRSHTWARLHHSLSTDEGFPHEPRSICPLQRTQDRRTKPAVVLSNDSEEPGSSHRNECFRT